jgi:hypothetical protein
MEEWLRAETATTTTGVAMSPENRHGMATTDNTAALAAAVTAPAILTRVDKMVGTVVWLAHGTMGQYVTNTTAVVSAGHAHNQAAAVAHSASAVVGLVDASQWDWAAANDDDQVQKNLHASETAGLRDDEQAVLEANQKADEEFHHNAHWTANHMAHRGDGTYNPQGLEALAASLGNPRPRSVTARSGQRDDKEAQMKNQKSK